MTPRWSADDEHLEVEGVSEAVPLAGGKTQVASRGEPQSLEVSYVSAV